MTPTASFSSIPVNSEIINNQDQEILILQADLILDPLPSQQCVPMAEICAIPTEHPQNSQGSIQQTNYRIATINNIQPTNRTGAIKSNSPFRDNCLLEKPPDQKK